MGKCKKKVEGLYYEKFRITKFLEELAQNTGIPTYIWGSYNHMGFKVYMVKEKMGKPEKPLKGKSRQSIQVHSETSQLAFDRNLSKLNFRFTDIGHWM